MIYLDHAATSWPKPPSVYEKMLSCMRHEGGNPGRGAHALSLRAAERIYSCRECAAAFFGAAGAERVAFTLNTTYALNTAIKSILSPGDHVLIGDMEHNSVLRPLAALAKTKQITYSTFHVRKSPEAILSELQKKIQPHTRALICAHVPNLANNAIPVAEIGAFCHKHGVIFILDGAQSAGHLPICVDAMHVDILCVPGHKGLYGPQGCAMMIFGQNCPIGAPLTEGGSGIHSLDLSMPEELPEHFEAGTLPTPAIAGLEAGIQFVKFVGLSRIHAHECRLWHILHGALSDMQKIHIADETPGAILTFTADNLSPTEIAERLNQKNICVRAGYHCAPLGHRALGTEETGAVRISFGIMNTAEEILTCADALHSILQGK